MISSLLHGRILVSSGTSKSAAIAFPGTLNANQRRKIKLGSFVGIWKKDQSTDLESERNLRMKRERKEVSLQFAKLAVNVPNAHCQVIYIAGGDFCFYYWRSH